MNARPNPIEVDFVRSFIDKSRQDRWLELMKPRRRAKFQRMLDHNGDFDGRWIQHLTRNEPRDQLIGWLGGAARQCHILSSDPEIDGTTMVLEDALDTILFSGFGAVIIVDPKRLALHESEEDRRYLMRRPPDR